ncbi:hypothetical protein BXP70_25305 [Hymenobacter crusticola]|uniref:Uncharacterized protein n=2 Tax=Hymenobacter crusticola TaxID=1770526 RepID=A0A2C9ZTY5_9BACT|nr:hypothetical protein BXP70_25305 [Hymenobacter crusticola]
MHRYMQRRLARLELDKLAYYEQGNHQAWELERTEVQEAIDAVLAALERHFPFPEALRISI